MNMNEGARQEATNEDFGSNQIKDTIWCMLQRGDRSRGSSSIEQSGSEIACYGESVEDSFFKM